MFQESDNRHHHADFINFLIKKFNYKSYLEIGFFEGHTYFKVDCRVKCSVDPNIGLKTYYLGVISDQTLAHQHKTPPDAGYVKYTMRPPDIHDLAIYHDAIFFNLQNNNIMGHFQKTSDDFFDEAIRGNEYGSDDIMKYDVIYVDGDHTYDVSYRDLINSLDLLSDNGVILVDDISPPLGEENDAQPWMSWIRLRSEREDLSMASILTGKENHIGVIKRGSQETLDKECMEKYFNVDYFNENREFLLNIIDYQELENLLAK